MTEFAVGQIATHKTCDDRFEVYEIGVPAISFYGIEPGSRGLSDKAPVLLMADEFEFDHVPRVEVSRITGLDFHSTAESVSEVLSPDLSADAMRLHHAEVATAFVERALERAELEEAAVQIESEPVEVDPVEAWEPVGAPTIEFGGSSMVDYLLEAAAVHARLAQAFGGQ